MYGIWVGTKRCYSHVITASSEVLGFPCFVACVSGGSAGWLAVDDPLHHNQLSSSIFYQQGNTAASGPWGQLKHQRPDQCERQINSQLFLQKYNSCYIWNTVIHRRVALFIWLFRVITAETKYYIRIIHTYRHTVTHVAYTYVHNAYLYYVCIWIYIRTQYLEHTLK